MDIVLGAGLAGLSAAYHIGHKQCVLLEKSARPFGRVHSECRNGFIWDEGPHVSFTKSDYVKELFKESVCGAYKEFEAKIGNFYQGHWIDHPAQSNFFQIPEPLRSQCLQSFLETRETANQGDPSTDYATWLSAAFGSCFATHFPEVYTRKYWTVESQDLTTDWIGNRVFLPSVEDVVAGARAPADRTTHYIQNVCYPLSGGYESFARMFTQGADIRLNREVVSVDLVEKCVQCSSGETFPFTRLVSTIPLPAFVRLCRQASPEALEAARALSCSQLLLVECEIPHQARRPENLFYVYDEDKHATRINFTEKLSSENAPWGHSGIQVEVYFSRHKPLPASPQEIAEKVMDELVEMGLIDGTLDKKALRYSWRIIEWANVIFTHQTRQSLSILYDWLALYGLKRHGDRDLNPITDWNRQEQRKDTGSIVLAGRFGAWKYYWSDDCVLNGRYL